MTRAITTLAIVAGLLAACATAPQRDYSRAATDGPHFGAAVTGGSVRGPG